MKQSVTTNLEPEDYFQFMFARGDLYTDTTWKVIESVELSYNNLGEIMLYKGCAKDFVECVDILVRIEIPGRWPWSPPKLIKRQGRAFKKDKVFVVDFF